MTEFELGWSVDHVEPGKARGWCVDATGYAPARLRLVGMGQHLCYVVADDPRPDVLAAGGRTKFCGFEFEVAAEVFGGADSISLLTPRGGKICDIPAPAMDEDRPFLFHFDEFDTLRISGWVLERSSLARPIYVRVFVGGVVVASGLANGERSDVAAAYGVTANCGFRFDGLSPVPPSMSALVTFGDRLILSRRLFEVAGYGLGDGFVAIVVPFSLDDIVRIKEVSERRRGVLELYSSELVAGRVGGAAIVCRRDARPSEYQFTLRSGRSVGVGIRDGRVESVRNLVVD